MIDKSPSKLDLWLQHYLDDSNSITFMNSTRSAMAAGYKCNGYNSFACIGRQNFKKLQPKIETWLNEEGLTPAKIKAKLTQLAEAKQTEFFAYQGMVVDEREVPALGIQIQAAKLAAKVLGMEAPRKHELAGMDGKGLEVTIKPDMTPQEAERAYSQMLKGDE